MVHAKLKLMVWAKNFLCLRQPYLLKITRKRSFTSEIFFVFQNCFNKSVLIFFGCGTILCVLSVQKSCCRAETYFNLRLLQLKFVDMVSVCVYQFSVLDWLLRVCLLSSETFLMMKFKSYGPVYESFVMNHMNHFLIRAKTTCGVF